MYIVILVVIVVCRYIVVVSSMHNVVRDIVGNSIGRIHCCVVHLHVVDVCSYIVIVAMDVVVVYHSIIVVYICIVGSVCDMLIVIKDLVGWYIVVVFIS